MTKMPIEEIKQQLTDGLTSLQGTPVEMVTKHFEQVDIPRVREYLGSLMGGIKEARQQTEEGDNFLRAVREGVIDARESVIDIGPIKSTNGMEAERITYEIAVHSNKQAARYMRMGETLDIVDTLSEMLCDELDRLTTLRQEILGTNLEVQDLREQAEHAFNNFINEF